MKSSMLHSDALMRVSYLLLHSSFLTLITKAVALLYSMSVDNADVS